MNNCGARLAFYTEVLYDSKSSKNMVNKTMTAIKR